MINNYKEHKIQEIGINSLLKIKICRQSSAQGGVNMLQSLL